MLPIVIRTTEQMLSLVPQRAAGGQLRARQPEGAHDPHGRAARTRPPGIVSGALLAVARAAGETAPLLFTIGIVTETNWSLFDGPNTALSVQIFQNAHVAVPRPRRTGPGAPRSR